MQSNTADIPAGTKFIVVDNDNNCAFGKSLSDAFTAYDDNLGNYDFEDLMFFEVVPVKCSLEVIPEKKIVSPIKPPAKPATKKAPIRKKATR